MNGWLVALGLFAAYVVFVFWIVQTGRLQRWNLSLMLGIVLMVRTQHGKGLIDTVSRPRRFWNAFGDVGTGVTLAGMAMITGFFLWSVYFVLRPGSGVEPLGASEILVIPGVNPFVPLWYGIAALIITLVVHEGGHGVLARANNMRLKSLGLLIAVVPIGAFVEPDEEDLRSSPRRQRLRVYGAGPMVNLVFAALTLMAFSGMVDAAEPAEGVPVGVVFADSPADRAGLEPGDIIIRLDGKPVPTYEAYDQAVEPYRPGQNAILDVADGRSLGITFQSRWERLPDETREEIMDGSEAGIAFCKAGEWGETSGECAQALHDEPVIGFQPLSLAFLADPVADGCLSDESSIPCPLQSFLTIISLPISEVRGSDGTAPVLGVYLPAFHEEPFGGQLYWIVATLLFWVFWINLMVGLTNVLPMLPLDGGHIFRDAVGGVVASIRPGMDPVRRDRVVGYFAAGVSLTILGAFLLQIFGPRFL